MSKAVIFTVTVLFLMVSAMVFIFTNTELERQVVSVEQVTRQFYDDDGEPMGTPQHFTRTTYRRQWVIGN